MQANTVFSQHASEKLHLRTHLAKGDVLCSQGRQSNTALFATIWGSQEATKYSKPLSSRLFYACVNLESQSRGKMIIFLDSSLSNYLVVQNSSWTFNTWRLLWSIGVKTHVVLQNIERECRQQSGCLTGSDRKETATRQSRFKSGLRQYLDSPCGIGAFQEVGFHALL